MLEPLGPILVGLALIALVGAVGLGAFLWWDRRKMDQAIKTAAKSGSGGGGGPREPA